MSSRLTLSTSSRTYIRVAISATEGGVTVNPTNKPVYFSFPDVGESILGQTWSDASWETSGSTYYARILVGPQGGLVLPAGSYEVWVKIDEGVERPANRTGLLEMF